VVAASGADMTLLVGRHVNKIDKKGRVSVPKPFRDAFIKRYEKREGYRYFDLWGCRGAGSESKS